MRHSDVFMAAATSLANVYSEGKEKGWKAVPLGVERERRLIFAVTELAKSFGTTLEPIHAIDGNGEFRIVVEGAGKNPNARFDEQFADALNQYGKPRTGGLEFGYTAEMGSTSNWCYIKHFAAERMVLICAGLA